MAVGCTCHRRGCSLLGGLSTLAGGSWCVQVPAVPGTAVLDVTGCGNAFCGAFLRSLDLGRSLGAAAQWGCVAGGGCSSVLALGAEGDAGGAAPDPVPCAPLTWSAPPCWGCAGAGSLMAEYHGVPPATPRSQHFQQEAAARLAKLQPLARRVQLRRAPGALRAALAAAGAWRRVRGSCAFRRL